MNGVSWPTATLVEPFPLYVRALSAAWWNGSMRVAYAGDGVLKYAELFGGTWIVSALEEANEAGAMVRLAFGPNGERWVAYHDLSLDALRVLGPGPAVAGADCAGCPVPVANSVRAVRVPNPLHGGEAITFDLQVGVRAPFEAALFDVAGRRVAVREFGALSPGTHMLEWRPRSLQPGAYFLRMALGDGAPATRRLVLLR